MVCGGLWWFAVVCGGLWWIAVVCLLVIPDSTCQKNDKWCSVKYTLQLCNLIVNIH